jgi:hypothetical protein
MKWNQATWKKDGQTITGQWAYDRSSDEFVIFLDNPDPNNCLRLPGLSDSLDFNGWTRVMSKEPTPCEQ